MSHRILNVNVSLQSINHPQLCEQMLDIMTRDDVDTLLVVTSTQRISISSKLLQIFSPLYREILRDVPSTDKSPVTIILPDTEVVHVKHLLDLVTSGRVMENHQSSRSSGSASDIADLAECFKIVLTESDLTLPSKPRQASLKVKSIKEMSDPVPRDGELSKRTLEKTCFINNASNVINIDDEEDDENEKKNKKCRKCGKIIGGGEEVLKVHEKRCNKEKPYSIKCNICEIRYKDAKGFAEHMIDAAGHFRSLPLFQCSICHKRFFKQKKLKEHYSKKHKSKPSQLSYKFLEDKKGPPIFFYEM